MESDNAIVKAQDSSRDLAKRQERSSWAFSEEKKTPHLRDYWHVLVKHRWIILTSFLVAMIIVATATSLQKSVYKATATIKIDKAESKILKFDPVSPTPDDRETNEYYQTQYKLLTSYSLAERVVNDLKLDSNREFLGTHTQQASGEASTTESPVVERFLKKLTIEPVKATALVKIAFFSQSPELAAKVANAMVDGFIEQSIDQKLDATKYAGRFLEKQIRDVKEKLQRSEEQLSKFAKQKQYLVLDEKQEQTTRQLAVLTDALMRERSERLVKEGLYRQAEGEDFHSLPSVLESPLIVELKKEFYRLQAEYRKLSETFLPDYPRVVALKSNIDEVEARLRSEVERVVNGLRSSYEAARRAEQLLQTSVDQQKQITLKTNDDSIQYNILKREADINRELYTSLSQRSKETGVSAGLGATNIQIIDRAKVPLRPDHPKKALNLMLGFLSGLVLGVGLAFVREYFDNTVNKVEQVESMFGLPILGVVPALASIDERNWLKAVSDGAPAFSRVKELMDRRKRLTEMTSNQETKPFELVMHHDKSSVASEAIRNLRTSLLFSLPEHPPKLLMVTSAEPGDGKTGVSINLAIALSQLGGDILLIDADMRSPDCHRILERDRKPGLSNFLVGDAELSAAIKPTDIPNLYLLPAGESSSNPAELVGSERMKSALELLRQQFKHVIIDTPPAGFTDSALLSTFVDGTILVIRAGKTVRDAARMAVRTLDSVDAKILGVVLNSLVLHNHGYSYYHDYHEYYRRKSERRESAISRRDSH